MTKTWKRIRAIVPLVLLAMILVRLIWIQLRVFPLELPTRSAYTYEYLDSYAGLDCSPLASPLIKPSATTSEPERSARIWLASPAYTGLSVLACADGRLSQNQMVRFNMWLMLMIALIGAMLVRFLTSSWIVALGVAAMLLSRGHLVGQVAVSGQDLLMMVTLTAWAASVGHYVRTGSLASLICIALAGLFSVLVNWTAVGLFLAFPFVLGAGYVFRRRLAGPVMRRLRGLNQRMRFLVQQSGAWPKEEDAGALGKMVSAVRYSLGLDFQIPEGMTTPWKPDYRRGTILRTLDVPFALWVYHRRRWLKIGSIMGASAILVMIAGLAAHGLMADYASQSPIWTVDINGIVETMTWDWFVNWVEFQWQEVDLHLGVSILVILVCAVQSPAEGLIGFIEGMWLVGAAVFLVLIVAIGADALDDSILNQVGIDDWSVLPRQVINWFEPVILSLGVAGIYNLMKVLDTRAGDRA